MRSNYCPQGHELTWLTNDLAVCGDCDDDVFIYHRESYLQNFVQFLQHKMHRSRAQVEHVRAHTLSSRLLHLAMH
jgi:hypothetical protein